MRSQAMPRCTAPRPPISQSYQRSASSFRSPVSFSSYTSSSSYKCNDATAFLLPSCLRHSPLIHVVRHPTSIRNQTQDQLAMTLHPSPARTPRSSDPLTSHTRSSAPPSPFPSPRFLNLHSYRGSCTFRPTPYFSHSSHRVQSNPDSRRPLSSLSPSTA